MLEQCELDRANIDGSGLPDDSHGQQDVLHCLQESLELFFHQCLLNTVGSVFSEPTVASFGALEQRELSFRHLHFLRTPG